MSRAAQLAFTVTLGAHLTECSGARQPAEPAALPATNPAAQLGPEPTGRPEPSAIAAVPSADAGPWLAGAASADAGSPEPVRHPMRIVLEYGAPAHILDQVCFSGSSSRVPKAALVTIQAVAEVLAHHPFRVTVQGLVAPEDQKPSTALPRKRAAAVVDALVAAGVSRERLAIAVATKAAWRRGCVAFLIDDAP